MKTSLLVLSTLVATAISHADDKVLVIVPNPHGQSTAIYTRSSRDSVALFGSKAQARAKTAAPVPKGKLKAVSHVNCRGQAVVHYVRVQE